MIEEIIAPYVKNIWKRDNVPLDLKALLIVILRLGTNISMKSE